MPVKGAEKGNEPEESADDGEARLHYVAPLVGQLPLGEEGAIVELKARSPAPPRAKPPGVCFSFSTSEKAKEQKIPAAYQLVTLFLKRLAI